MDSEKREILEERGPQAIKAIDLQNLKGMGPVSSSWISLFNFKIFLFQTS
jgi:hypothetical protein